jgi:hypothetical protein
MTQSIIGCRQDSCLFLCCDLALKLAILSLDLASKSQLVMRIPTKLLIGGMFFFLVLVVGSPSKSVSLARVCWQQWRKFLGLIKSYAMIAFFAFIKGSDILSGLLY